MNEIKVASILNKQKRRDSWFLTDYTVNPYGGCSFNCLYCYIRGSTYGAEMKVSVKKNAAELLARQLSRRAKNRVRIHRSRIGHRSVHAGRRVVTHHPFVS